MFTSLSQICKFVRINWICYYFVTFIKAEYGIVFVWATSWSYICVLCTAYDWAYFKNLKP